MTGEGSTEEKRKKRRHDLFLIGVLLLLALGLWFLSHWGRKTGAWVEVYVDGERKQRISLEEEGNYTIETPWGTNQLQVRNHCAKMVKADCKDKLCMQQKVIEREKETIVCLPHKVVVEICAGEEGQLDGITN